ncbi:MAG TPA: hypothetical protein VG425_03940 [Casimicrobiaceae bacterium]|jgi:hypothetical protein|nr:hypothetical protein [Casimicrobiaceae bacterium]
MQMYDTDNPSRRRQHDQNVQAWMRAAAYAAGTEPDEALFVMAEPGNVEVRLAQAVAAEERDDHALSAALESMVLIGQHERQDPCRTQAENDDLVAARAR